MDEGLSYYMPKKDLKVTVTVEDHDKIHRTPAKITKIDLDTTEAYPDLSKRYVLKHQGSLVSKNDLHIGITENGLLTSSKSTTTSKINEAFKSLAASAPVITRNKTVIQPTEPLKCKVPGIYTFLYEIPDSEDKETLGAPCGIGIDIKKLTSKAPLELIFKAHLEGTKNTKIGSAGHIIFKAPYSGIFYRQNEPYKVSASGKVINGFNVQKIIFSPSNSKTSLLPVKKTLFSDNVADFGLEDGVPTKYNQDVDAELVALLKLPADIFTSYFAAIGTTFEAFKKQETDEAALLNASLALELVKYKHAACIEAIKSKNDELINSLECKTN